eukprot:445041_1
MLLLVILSVLFSINLAAQNCPHCGSVNECFADCNEVDQYFITGSWRQCKLVCARRGKCAIRSKQRCFCAKGCDNIKNNDAQPVGIDNDGFDPNDYDFEEYISNKEPMNNEPNWEYYAAGVATTLFILICAFGAYCVFAVAFKKPSPYEKVLNVQEI